MKLRNIDFGSVHGASGVEGFFGEGYPYHRCLKLLLPGMFSFKGMTFVAKTTTLFPRAGNMPLEKDGLTPREFRPKCIVVSPFKGIALNAVGLSGPGAEFLFRDGRWQSRTKPFFISFMSVEKDVEKRKEEIKLFVELFKKYLHSFRAPVGLQINFSCPNVGLHSEELLSEVDEVLTIASVLQIPLMPKFNLLITPEMVAEITRHASCDAVCISNTLPWGSLPERIKWKELFGTDESPLKKFGGGGLSGALLLPLLLEWLEQARKIVEKPICAGGGILSPREIGQLAHYRPGAVALGSIVMLRPWRLARTIQKGIQLI